MLSGRRAHVCGVARYPIATAVARYRPALSIGSMFLPFLIACNLEPAHRPLTQADSTVFAGDWIGAVFTQYFNATLFLHFAFGEPDTVGDRPWRVTVDGPHAQGTVRDAEFNGRVLRLWLARSGAPAIEGTLDGVRLDGRCRINPLLTGECLLVRIGHEGSVAALEAAQQGDRLGWRGVGEVAGRYALRSRVDSAFIWLERAADMGMTVVGAYSLRDLEHLRHHERFGRLFPDPVAAHPALSQRRYTVELRRQIRIPMRDGVELLADLALPVSPAVSRQTTRISPGDSTHSAAATFPTILLRTPYGRARELDESGWFAPYGYVVVSQTVRGREESGGSFDPWVHERADGYDTIEWIARQPWSNGRVGMFGGSYVGQVQWAAAAERPPALKTIVPMASGTDYMFDVPYSFGVPRLSLIHWLDNLRGGPPQRGFARSPERLKTVPLSQLDERFLGYDSEIWNRWLERDVSTAWSRANFVHDLDAATPPVLHLSGWWDAEAMGTARNYAALSARGHLRQWLMYGPWPHNLNSSSRFADVDDGPDALVQLEPVFVRWFDAWLKGKPELLATEPMVRVFVTGANRWQEYDSWPPSDAESVAFFLGSDAPLRGAMTQGRLSRHQPSTEGAVHRDGYVYDPAAVSVLGPYGGRIDFSRTTKLTFPRDARDMLVYASSPFDAPLDLSGPATLELYFSTSARDTDVFALVIDIDARGTMRAIHHPGKMRLRYLTGWGTPTTLQPDSVYRVEIELFPFAHRFDRGHRLGLVLRSEFFPAFARNLNTGAPVASARSMAVARQRVYHEERYPSALRLWRLPRVSPDGGR